MLRLLIDEWGYDEVEAAIKQFRPNDQNLFSLRQQSQATHSGHRPQRRSKPLAVDQVEHTGLPKQQEDLLREIARRFDLKQFLPSSSDVREFLLMMDQGPTIIRDRSDAFRKVLRALSVISMDRLEEIANSALHSGPSQLGPLSDAISAAATSLSRHRDQDDK